MLGKRATASGGRTVNRKITKKWKEEVKSDEEEEKDDEPEVTEADLEAFRRQNAEEEKEERRRKWLAAQAKEKEDKEASTTGKKKKKSKAFEWMSSGDEEDDDEDEEEQGQGKANDDEKSSIEKKEETRERESVETPPILTSADGLHAGLPPPQATQSSTQPMLSEEEPGLSLQGSNNTAPCFQGREHLFKTRVCQRWAQGYCQWSNECMFAHGEDELKRAQLAAANASLAAAATASKTTPSFSPLVPARIPSPPNPPPIPQGTQIQMPLYHMHTAQAQAAQAQWMAAYQAQAHNSVDKSGETTNSWTINPSSSQQGMTRLPVKPGAGKGAPPLTPLQPPKPGTIPQSNASRPGQDQGRKGVGSSAAVHNRPSSSPYGYTDSSLWRESGKGVWDGTSAAQWATPTSSQDSSWSDPSWGGGASAGAKGWGKGGGSASAGAKGWEASAAQDWASAAAAWAGKGGGAADWDSNQWSAGPRSGDWSGAVASGW